jgi:uncharacterized membrane protein
MVDNEILRENARAQLGNGIFHSRWLNMLLVCAISSTLMTLTATLAKESALFSFGESIINFLLAGALSYGMARVAVNCIKGNPWGIKQAFCGFQEGYGKTLLLHFLHSLFIFLWGLLLIIPGIVKSYSYAMVYYLQQEDGGLNREPVDLITDSRHLMEGYKWQLFCLDLSFIGWYLLGALCFGIGLYFVVPYHEMARANFYMALRVEKGLDVPVSQMEEEDLYA